MPRVYLMPSDDAERLRDRTQPPARRGGGDRGIMRILDEEELEGVLAHELSHVEEPRRPDLDHRRARSPAPSPISPTWPSGPPCSAAAGRDDEDGGSSPIAMILAGDPRADRRAARADGGLPLARVQADATGARSPDVRGACRRRSRSSRWPTQASADGRRNPATAHLFIVNPLSGADAARGCSRPTLRPGGADRPAARDADRRPAQAFSTM